MRVIAIARGYDNITTREIGEEFDMPANSAGAWFRPKDGASTTKVEPEASKADKPPKTMSEAAKRKPEADKPPKTMSEAADASDETPLA